MKFTSSIVAIVVATAIPALAAPSSANSTYHQTNSYTTINGPFNTTLSANSSNSESVHRFTPTDSANTTMRHENAYRYNQWKKEHGAKDSDRQQIHGPGSSHQLQNNSTRSAGSKYNGTTTNNHRRDVLGTSSSPINGEATFFYQGGTPDGTPVAGACGVVHQDSAQILALSEDIFSLDYCFEWITICDSANPSHCEGAQVADACPGCDSGHVDLSTGTFNLFRDESVGVFNIYWFKSD